MTPEETIWYGAFHDEISSISNNHTEDERSKSMYRLKKIFDTLSNQASTPLNSTSIPSAISDEDAASKNIPLGDPYIAATGATGVRVGTLLFRQA